MKEKRSRYGREFLPGTMGVRLFPRDLEYLNGLSSKTTLAVGWYVRAAVEDWVKRDRKRKGARRFP